MCMLQQLAALLRDTIADQQLQFSPTRFSEMARKMLGEFLQRVVNRLPQAPDVVTDQLVIDAVRVVCEELVAVGDEIISSP